jgi:hypothetical protein
MDIPYRIAAELPNFPEGSVVLRNPHYNLHIIRRALAPLGGAGAVSAPGTPVCAIAIQNGITISAKSAERT